MKKNSLTLIYLSEMTVRFCTWTVLSGLLIHITKSEWVTTSKGLYIMGTSLSLLYLCSILGGFIKDRFFNEEQCIILGIFLIAAGNLGLLFLNTFYLALGILFIGAGMVTPNTPLLLSRILNNKENNKAFTYFYGITNSGIILGPIIGGYVENFFSWRGVILLNEIMIIIWFLFAYTAGWLNYLRQLNSQIFIKFWVTVLFTAVLVFFCLTFQSISKYILIISIIGYLIFLISTIRIFKEDKKKILFSLILTLFAIVFFCGEFQVTSSLIVYADNFVRLKEFNFNIPVTSLVSLESIFVVLGAFIITKMALFTQIKFSQTRVLIGLCCSAIAFLILYFSTWIVGNEKISLLWIVFPSLLLGLGEVSLMPPIISYIAKESPPDCKGRLLSGMYFALSISGYISGFIGEIIMQHHHLSNKDLVFYSTIFLTIVIISIIFSLVLAILRFNSMRFLGISQ